MPSQSDSTEVSSFSIRELSGEDRHVVLAGRGLPYRPFDLSTGQRSTTTWLPGLPIATINVFGPKEEPTTINGFWKDIFIGATDVSGAAPIQFNNLPVTNVRDAVDLFDDIVRQGQLVEVLWLNQKRQGLITKFNKRWHNAHDVEWSITFDWASRGEQFGPAVFIDSVQLSDVRSLLQAGMQKVQDTPLPPKPLSYAYTAPLNALGNSLNDSVSLINSILTQYTNSTIQPYDASRQAIAAFTGVITQCSAMSVYVQSNPPSSVLAQPATQQSALTQLNAMQWAQEFLSNLRALKYTTVEQRDAFIRTIQGDLIGQYIAGVGDDLRDVSFQFYNTPFEWQRIMLYNVLTGSQLTAGQLVLVPRINVADQVQA
jgi:hypothetical protein